MIELKNVSKFYSDNNIVTIGLKNINLKLNKGEFVAITGDSGSGKSTLLNVISLIDTYDEGEILFYGNETFYFNQNDSDIFRKENVSFIFQKYNIIDSYSVLENVMLPLLIKGIDEAKAKQQALEIIDRVGLKHRANNKGTKLSGGEKQRCVIARALASDAPILACDEPTGNLDSKTSMEIINLIKEVSQDKLVLIVTHDYESIKDICTRKIKLSDGEIVEDITFKEGIAEDKKELLLKDSKPSNKTLFKLSMLNIFSTPKKTTFSSLVFTFVSMLFLLLSLFMVQVSYEENYTYNDSYGIIAENRMIIYEDKHESLDMDKLKSVLNNHEYYENAFYEESNIQIRIESSFYANVNVTFTNLEFELVAGVNTPNKDEFVIVMPNYSYYDQYDSLIGKKILAYVLASNLDYSLSIGTLAGIGVSNTVNDIYLMCDKSNMNVANMVINNTVSLNFNSSKTNRTIISKVYDETATKSYFLIPSSLKDDIEFNFNLKNLYDVTYDLDVVYSDTETTPKLIIDNNYMKGNVSANIDGVKEISVYTNNPRKLSKAIKRLGYDVCIPSMVKHQDGMSLILLYLLTIVIVVALLIMFFISFAIIQRIYLTKTKDYSIFRTLGLVSNDLKKMLFIEIITTTLISIIAGFILSNLIIIISQTDLYKYESLILIIIYAVTMLVFGLLTASRLNNRIFKHSVYQALKEGSE